MFCNQGRSTSKRQFNRYLAVSCTQMQFHQWWHHFENSAPGERGQASKNDLERRRAGHQASLYQTNSWNDDVRHAVAQTMIMMSKTRTTATIMMIILVFCHHIFRFNRVAECSNCEAPSCGPKWRKFKVSFIKSRNIEHLLATCSWIYN